MKILLNDLMQYSDAPAALKSAALSDVYDEATTIPITFDDSVSINCIGIGFTDATEITITDGIITDTIYITQDAPYHNGLYLLSETQGGDEYGDAFTISHNGSYIGRVGVGMYKTLGTNPTKEIGWYSTQENRKTLSGQTIPGAGGYSGRRAEMDVRYKIDSDIYTDIDTAYVSQISKDFPFFILFDDEQHKLPTNMLHFYANAPIGLLQSSSYRFLYSYKFSFREAF
jgi:hypothetical protein